MSLDTGLAIASLIAAIVFGALGARAGHRRWVAHRQRQEVASNGIAIQAGRDVNLDRGSK